MGHHHEEQSLMAELAKIFEEEDLLHHAPGGSGATASAPQLPGGVQHPTARCGAIGAPPAAASHQACSHAHAGKSQAAAQEDPFLLPGDETTWVLDEWAWDPLSLSAMPKPPQQQQQAAAGMACQDPKRRRVQEGYVAAPGANSSALSDSSCAAAATSHLTLAPTTATGALVNPHGRRPAGDPQASSCCTFRMPSMHVPYGFAAPTCGGSGCCGGSGSGNGMVQGGCNPGMPGDAGCAAPAWAAAAAMLPGVPWREPNSAIGGMLPPPAPNMPHLPSNPMYAQQASAAGPHAQAAAAAAAGDAAQHGGWGMPPHSQSLHPALPAALPHAASGAAGLGSPDVLVAAASSVASRPALAAAAGLPTGCCWGSSAGTATPRPAPSPAPTAAASTAVAVPPSAAAATAALEGGDSDGDSDAEAGGAGSKLGSTSGTNAACSTGAARKGPALPPATYTGSLDDVVKLSDTCVDEAARMQCQVAGCGKDLSSLKEYHQRYRICEVHIKLPQVLKDGRLQRFCQQCGRFHDLSAFDAGRKSCREQLSKHNARRRRRAQLESQKATQKAKAMEQLSSVMPGVIAASGAGDPPGAGSSGGGGSGPADGSGAGSGDVGRLLSQLMQNPAQLAALRLLLGVQTHPALPPLQPFSPDTSSAEAAVSGGGGGPSLGDPPTYGLARDVLDGKGVWAPGFESDHQVLRVSMKLFNRTPSDLPPDLRQQVASWLSSMPAGLAGAIRPGCVFLTLALLLDSAAYKDATCRGLSSLLQHLRTATGCGFWHEGAYVVQLAGEMALLVHGRVTAYYRDHSFPAPSHEVSVEAATPCTSRGTAAAGHDANSMPREYPQTASVSPLCMAAPTAAMGTPSGSVSGAIPQYVEVRLRGSHLRGSGVELIARQGNTQLRLPLVSDPDDPDAVVGHVPVETVPHLRDAHKHSGSGTAAAPNAAPGGGVSGVLKCGVMWLEVQRGAWLGPAHPILVVDDPALAAEVSQLGDACCRADLSPAARDMLVVDLGMVLAHTTPTNTIHGSCSTTRAAPASGCFQGVAHREVARKARRLLLFACDMGWAAVAARVLPLATADCACASEVIDAVHASSAPPALQASSLSHHHLMQASDEARPTCFAAQLPPAGHGRSDATASPTLKSLVHAGSHSTQHRQAAEAARTAPHQMAPVGPQAVQHQQLQLQQGLSLLHRVVRSGNLTLLQGVLHWGAVCGYRWRADRNGPGGITPLHLAALQEDPRMLLALLDYAPPGAFTTLQAQDGTTPFHLAFQMGHFTLDSLAAQLAKEQLLPDGAGTSTETTNGTKKPTKAARPAGSRMVAPADEAPVAKAAVAAIAAQHGGAAAGPEVFTASMEGSEVEPCRSCHCRLPPILLSIAAACADCGERVPCLGGLTAMPSAAGGAPAGTPAAAGKAAAAAVHRTAPGHDTEHCAGCVTEAMREQAARKRAAAAKAAQATASLSQQQGRKRTAWEAWGSQGHMAPETANNCTGALGWEHTHNNSNSSMCEGEDGCSAWEENEHTSHQRQHLYSSSGSHAAAASSCVHVHGSVYSVTAMCQGCHANRVLEVV